MRNMLRLFPSISPAVKNSLCCLGANVSLKVPVWTTWTTHLDNRVETQTTTGSGCATAPRLKRHITPDPRWTWCPGEQAEAAPLNLPAGCFSSWGAFDGWLVLLGPHRSASIMAAGLRSTSSVWRCVCVPGGHQDSPHRPFHSVRGSLNASGCSDTKTLVPPDRCSV